ncbi:hypothetical protein Q8G40_29240, partial [Klebsiella pneumoniae]|uniref:hypothetical protein n=1 Tax=Klebsiella pneumoniae TaxID=573 RepID=UPI003013EC9F
RRGKPPPPLVGITGMLRARIPEWKNLGRSVSGDAQRLEMSRTIDSYARRIAYRQSDFIPSFMRS